MEIAFYVSSFPMLSETFILNQITGMIDRGHAVTIFGDRSKTPEKRHRDVDAYGLMEKTVYRPPQPPPGVGRWLDGVKLAARELARRPGAAARVLNGVRYGAEARSLRLLRDAAPLLARPCTFDGLVAHFGYCGNRAAMLKDAGLLAGRLAVFFHAFDVTTYLQWRGRRSYDFLLRSDATLLPISERWRRELLSLGAAEERTRVHHMGIDPEAIGFRVRRREGGAPVRVLSLGRLVEKKGFEYSIRAVGEARKANPALEYTIIGDGPLRAKLEEVNREAAGGAVKLAGWMEQGEVRRMVEQAHLFIMPSVTAANGDQEGIPVSLMEAMAGGVPVLATRHSGIPELVEDGVSGVLVGERDAAGLAARLGDLAAGPDRWESLGGAGRRKVEQEFNIHRLNDRLEALLAGRDARG